MLGTLSVDRDTLHVEPDKSLSIMLSEHWIKMSTRFSFKANRNCFCVSALTVATGFRLALDWVVNHIVSILDFLSLEKQ